ncbi:organic hydroperoxide resistance protein [Gynuella sunshinyii]|uniref:Putative redox protein, regulator of disulfide bond formation n=1 Tax=Gynuella sunshinyii YC6258 TaxID=1445510 RepID=A0A0C5VQ09_9GAMM|nr:organic hydroperoxide resistance protein [Gynuella sunshinyii]AJQ92359.1 putative redox protein, regulator of disulfide bond formation [Gynuella sunshinyii YC6258]
MSIENVLYRVSAESKGGRDGRSVSEAVGLDVKMATPKELGGAGGEGVNPEALFAAGYSACFIGAMKFVAAQNKKILPAETTVKATVGIGTIPAGFGIEVDLQVSIPGYSQEDAESLVEKAHQVCPYSNATRNNIDVRLSVVA